jgi:flagellar basal-body rod protein FlgG
LNGNGFFKVADSQGNISYTRNGCFYLDNKGFLINSSGMNLLNERNKPIRITGVNVTINGNGEIMESGSITDTIGLADFSPQDYLSLRETDRGLFAKPANLNETAVNPDTQFLQGYLEDSNVEPVMTMVDMIEIFRVFELGQKSIQIQDQSIGKSVNEVGVVK